MRRWPLDQLKTVSFIGVKASHGAFSRGLEVGDDNVVVH